MKILLIEDDREAASYLFQVMDEAGHVTHHATDGETGYAMASSMDYDVLIVDRMLPRRDGLSIVESLRAEGNKTPVLILSALGEVDDRVPACAPAATTISPSHMRSPSCWRASKCWHVARVLPKPRPVTRSATCRSIGCHARSSVRAR